MKVSFKDREVSLMLSIEEFSESSSQDKGIFQMLKRGVKHADSNAS
ncbi:MAG: hypothetical protein GXO97_06730 [Nitrospirae bacterium]|nr:hypothetical protein [Nitrospirota bacterium]